MKKKKKKVVKGYFSAKAKNSLNKDTKSVPESFLDWFMIIFFQFVFLKIVCKVQFCSIVNCIESFQKFLDSHPDPNGLQKLPPE